MSQIDNIIKNINNVHIYEKVEPEEILCDNKEHIDNNRRLKNDRWDSIIGVIQDLLLDAEFVELQNNFCMRNFHNFDENEENKLLYTEIFQQYTDIIETYIEKRLKKCIEGFSMEELVDMIQEQPDELSGDVFDVLMSIGDFEEFKCLMLSYKNSSKIDIKINGRKL